MGKIKKLAYNQEEFFLKFSNEVYGLDIHYKSILYIIARNGPLLISNIVKISGDQIPKSKIDQHTAYRRINGTPEKFSLLEKEYLFATLAPKGKRGNPQKIYHLTLKGMLAAVSFLIEIEDVYLFKRFVNFVCRPLRDDNLKELIQNYIKYSILLFLSWHFIHGISLQKQIASELYFEHFFENLNLNITRMYSEKINPEDRRNYRQMLEDYIATRETIEMLTVLADPAETIVISANPEETSKVEEQTKLEQTLYKKFTTPLKFNLVTGKKVQKTTNFVIGLIQYWPYFINNMYFDSDNPILKKVVMLPKKRPMSPIEFLNEDKKSNDLPIPFNRIEQNLAKFVPKKMATDIASNYTPKDLNFGGKFWFFRNYRMSEPFWFYE